MAFEFDDNAPSSYILISAPNLVSKPPESVPCDYTWLERFIPYDPSAENNVHWFVRFK